MKYYCGIGSRKTTPTVCGMMTHLAGELERDGYTLRSGNAEGADQAFAKGVVKNAQIWLPWSGFNLEFRVEHLTHDYRVILEYDQEAFDSVNYFHPNGPNLREPVRKLMARNYRQIKGLREENSQFVICWTPNGEEVGGTSQAIKIARHYDIPVYNLFNMTKEEVLREIHKLELLQ